MNLLTEEEKKALPVEKVTEYERLLSEMEQAEKKAKEYFDLCSSVRKQNLNLWNKFNKEGENLLNKNKPLPSYEDFISDLKTFINDYSSYHEGEAKESELNFMHVFFYRQKEATEEKIKNLLIELMGKNWFYQPRISPYEFRASIRSQSPDTINVFDHPNEGYNTSNQKIHA